jgi:hypothetical protein
MKLNRVHVSIKIRGGIVTLNTSKALRGRAIGFDKTVKNRFGRILDGFQF